MHFDRNCTYIQPNIDWNLLDLNRSPCNQICKYFKSKFRTYSRTKRTSAFCPLLALCLMTSPKIWPIIVQTFKILSIILTWLGGIRYSNSQLTGDTVRGPQWRAAVLSLPALAGPLSSPYCYWLRATTESTRYSLISPLSWTTNASSSSKQWSSSASPTKSCHSINSLIVSDKN